MRNPLETAPPVPDAVWAKIEFEARKLFAREQLSFNRNKEILFVERLGNRVVGAVAAGVEKNRYTGAFFSFDVVVASSAQGQGIGKKLIKAVDAFYEETKEENKELFGDEFHAKVYVINPVVEHILQQLGYHYTSQRELGSTMEKY